MNPAAPLPFTTSPRLDAALARGCDEWLSAARALGAAATLRWLARRADLSEQLDDLSEVVEALLDATDPDDAVGLLAELAELVTGDDDIVAEVLAEGVLAHGIATGDAEVIVDAVGHLAELAEAAGDPLTAAEYHVDFLNWRRQPEHSSDAESVATSFDEIVRLAELDGATRPAAIFGFRQVAFQRLADADAETAFTGDWDPRSSSYESWT